MIGKQILHYKIVEKLGQGGMGAVYKAEDTKLERTVALKFLPPNALGDKDDVARFVHEAQAAAALHHPNICTVFEINEADDQVFISMAYLPGDSLRDRIRSGPLTTKDTLRIAIDITKGLEAAHGKGVVHRDIKPTNIMFSETGAATVMDFGLAKSKKQTHVTRLGTTMGTIAYMSPEQTRGDDVDHRLLDPQRGAKTHRRDSKKRRPKLDPYNRKSDGEKIRRSLSVCGRNADRSGASFRRG
jgi:serine/threonine protein kinase